MQSLKNRPSFRTSTRYASLEKGCHLRPPHAWLCLWTLASSKMTLTSLPHAISSVPMQSTLAHLLYLAKKQFGQNHWFPSNQHFKVYIMYMYNYTGIINTHVMYIHVHWNFFSPSIQSILSGMCIGKDKGVWHLQLL